jgi:Tfp pilus assembly protein PilF
MGKMEKLKEMLLTEPGDPFLMHALALENISQGNEAEAERLFREILGVNPGYTGSYYHLGRLLERTGRPGEAASWYEKGMASAKKEGDRHAYGELQAAFDDVSDL